MAFLFTLFKPLAYLSVPVFVLRHVAASTPVGRYYIRLTLYVGALGLIATYAALASAVMTIVGQGLAINFVVARTFYAYTSRLIEIQIEVEGEEHMSTRPAVFMANHQSMLDVLIMGK
jgi:lysophosphatidate acyltransferase